MPTVYSYRLALIGMAQVLQSQPDCAKLQSNYLQFAIVSFRQVRELVEALRIIPETAVGDPARAWAEVHRGPQLAHGAAWADLHSCRARPRSPARSLGKAAFRTAQHCPFAWRYHRRRRTHQLRTGSDSGGIRRRPR